MFEKYSKFLKFVISGSFSALIDLLILKALVDKFDMWYILASSIAFVFAFIVSFILQKFWSFKHGDRTYIKGEVIMYLGVAILNLILNALILYFLIEFVNLGHLVKSLFKSGIFLGLKYRHSYGYVLAQIISGLLIGVWNFFFYWKVIFVDNKKMPEKLLFITQKVDINDSVLGFTHKWIDYFSKQFKEVLVITLENRESKLPQNVRVLSLGKEAGASNWKYIKNFFYFILKYRKEYDAVFVHMNTVYLVLGGFFWLVLKKKVYLWYIHPKIDKYLRLGLFFVNGVISASEGSFPLKLKNIDFVGHGIDVGAFNFEASQKREVNSIVCVGRIASVKNLDTVADAFKLIIKSKPDARLYFVGLAGKKDGDYERKLKEGLKDLIKSERVIFLGSISNKEMPSIYREKELLINVTDLGSFDKVVLEAMASGCLTIVSNSYFKDVLPETMISDARNPDRLASSILRVLDMNLDQKHDLRHNLRKYVSERHSLDSLSKKIADIIKK